MNAPVPSQGPIETRETAAPAPVEFRYADFRFSWWFVVFFAGMGWAAFGVDPPLLPPIFLLFAGGAGFAMMRYTRERFQHAGPWLVLDSEGLHSTPYERPRLDVCWDEIERLTCEHDRHSDYIGIWLKDSSRRLPARTLRIYGKWCPHLSIRIPNTEGSASKLVARICDYHASLGR